MLHKCKSFNLVHLPVSNLAASGTSWSIYHDNENIVGMYHVLQIWMSLL